MVKAGLIAWPQVLHCQVFKSMIKTCSDFDIDLEQIGLPNGCDAKHHYDIIKKYQNVISWVCYAASQQTIKSERNFLFLENGIINTRDYFFIDDNGYGLYSNIVAQQYNKQKYDQNYKNEVSAYLTKIGWKIGSGFRKDGYFLIILQSRTYDDIELLRKCEQYLPKGIKVLVRPHPNYVTDKNRATYNDFCQRNENWFMDSSTDVLMSLSLARAIITNFSSVMYKSFAMEVPVATCMPGFHSGTGASLECDRDPTLLKYILDFRHDQEASQNLICAIHKHSLSKDTTEEQLLHNTNFANWLKRIRQN